MATPQVTPLKDLTKVRDSSLSTRANTNACQKVHLKKSFLPWRETTRPPTLKVLTCECEWYPARSGSAATEAMKRSSGPPRWWRCSPSPLLTTPAKVGTPQAQSHSPPAPSSPSFKSNATRVCCESPASRAFHFCTQGPQKKEQNVSLASRQHVTPPRLSPTTPPHPVCSSARPCHFCCPFFFFWGGRCYNEKHE